MQLDAAKFVGGRTRGTGCFGRYKTELGIGYWSNWLHQTTPTSRSLVFFAPPAGGYARSANTCQHLLAKHWFWPTPAKNFKKIPICNVLVFLIQLGKSVPMNLIFDSVSHKIILKGLSISNWITFELAPSLFARKLCLQSLLILIPFGNE